MSIFTTIKDNLEFNKHIPELERWCIENNVEKKEFLPGIRKMFMYQSEVGRIINDLVKDSSDNICVKLFACLLCGVLEINQNEDSKYSYALMDSIQQIYWNMKNENGTLSEQFEIMIQDSYGDNHAL